MNWRCLPTTATWRPAQSCRRATEFGIVPYGVEALSIMRVEKGHVAGGELNGTTTAADLGMAKMMSTKKDYIGRMMAGREGLARSRARQCVVGIRPVDQGR